MASWNVTTHNGDGPIMGTITQDGDTYTARWDSTYRRRRGNVVELEARCTTLDEARLAVPEGRKAYADATVVPVE